MISLFTIKEVSVNTTTQGEYRKFREENFDFITDSYVDPMTGLTKIVIKATTNGSQWVTIDLAVEEYKVITQDIENKGYLEKEKE
jgi:hypothetical protein